MQLTVHIQKIAKSLPPRAYSVALCPIAPDKNKKLQLPDLVVINDRRNKTWISALEDSKCAAS